MRVWRAWTSDSCRFESPKIQEEKGDKVEEGRRRSAKRAEACRGEPQVWSDNVFYYI